MLNYTKRRFIFFHNTVISPLLSKVKKKKKSQCEITLQQIAFFDLETHLQ